MINLIIYDSENRSRKLELESAKTFTIGRNPENDIVLSDETVSRKHAALIVSSDGRIAIEDLNSIAGTYVNKTKIDSKISLYNNDMLLLGKTYIKTEAMNHIPHGTKVLTDQEIKKLLYNENETNDNFDINADQTLSKDEIRPKSYSQFHKLVSSNKEYILDKPEICIGRSKDCIIQVNDHMVSSHHLLLRTNNNKCIAKDLGSRNGTQINRSPMRNTHILQNGDEIEIGDTLFRFVHRNSAFSENMFPYFGQPEENGYFQKKMVAIAITLIFILLGTFLTPQFTKAYKSRKLDPVVTVAGTSENTTTAVNSGHTEIPGALEAAVKNTSMIDKPEVIKEETIQDNGSLLFEQGLEFYMQGNTQLALTRFDSVIELDLRSDNRLKSKAATLTEKIRNVQKLYEKGYKEYKADHLFQSIKTFKYVLEMDRAVVGKKNSYYSDQIFIYIVNSYYRIAKKEYGKDNFARAQEYCLKTLRLNPEHKNAIEMEKLLAENTMIED